MNTWTLVLTLLLTLGVAAGWLSKRLPPSGWTALALALVPLGGLGLTGMF